MKRKDLMSFCDSNSNFELPSLLMKDFIGFQDTFDQIKKAITEPSSINFPPYDIYTAMAEHKSDIGCCNEEHIFIQFALAGIPKDRLQVEFSPDNILTVKTKPTDYEALAKDLERNSKKYIYKGIAEREFTIEKSISKDLECVSCKMKDGMLTIEFRNKNDVTMQTQIIDIE